MRPMRGSLGGFGGFGGGGLQSVAGKLALAIVVASVLFALGLRSGLTQLLLLSPQDVLTHWALWQPLTYAFLATNPLSVIFCALIAYSIGSALEQTWGSKRLLRVALGYTVGAGVLTVLLSLLLPGLRAHRFDGGPVMLSVLWVAFGWSWGRAQTGFWGIPVTGNTLALIGVGFVFLEGAFDSWLGVIPQALGILLVFAGFRLHLGNPRLWWLKLQGKRLERQLRGRRKNLHVVPREDEPRRRDYLN